MAASVLDAPTRPKSSGVLTPGSEAAPQRNGSLEDRSRKRKRSAHGMEDILNDPIVIKPYASTIFVKPRTLRPLALLPREQLPLSCLDLFPRINPLPDSRLFEANVKILELESRMRSTALVLIARLDDGRSYYAVEIESKGLYAVCKLGSWVDLDALCADSILSVDLPRSIKRESISSIAGLSNPAADALIMPESSKYNQKKRAAIEAFQLSVKRPSLGSQPVHQSSAESVSKTDTATAMAPQLDVPNPLGEVTDVPQPDLRNLLENLRLQYLETLYLSKASLAYFVKGPLSRVRAAFHLDVDSTLDMKDLIEFLQTLVLPTSALERKYKDGIPHMVSAIDLVDIRSSIETGKEAKKKRRSKKMKLGKNGLYTNEDHLIQRWWESHSSDDIAIPGQSLENTSKRRIAQLRTRETQLQMIVILEALALQSHAALPDEDEDILPGAAAVATDHQTSTKTKKSRDLAALVDIHVDRLCIWQSVALEDSNGASKPGTNLPPPAAGSVMNPENAADILREFCIEVIVPFYSARLPDLCTSISQKLGGPVALTPGRPRMIKFPSISKASRPGAITKRPVPIKKHGSLRRALTDERLSHSGSRGPQTAISLMRSATLPSVTGLKRESSETPSLSSVPPAYSSSLHSTKGGPLQTRKLSLREVDLSNLTNGKDSRSQKDLLEDELKNVISAIRKPNRQLAGQTIMETAELRTLGAAHSRKLKKPARNTSFTGVQIMATPKLHRQKDMFGDTQNSTSQSQQRSFEIDAVPPSSVPRVPQSAARSAGLAARHAHPSGHIAVLATPSRGSSRSDFQEVSIVPPSSPLQPRHSNALQYSSCSKPKEGTFDKTRNLSVQRVDTIMVTPQKRMRALDGFSISPELARPSNNTVKIATAATIDEDISLYKSLGWDDLDDLA